MGLIKAAFGATGSVLGDQWREYFYCDSMPSDVLVAKGEKRVSGRSSNTRGSDNNVAGAHGKTAGEKVAHLFGDLNAVRVAGVGVAAVADDRLSDAVRYMMLRNLKRRALNKVRCINRRRGCGNLAVYKRKVAFSFVSANAAVNACRRKSVCGTNAAFYNLHFNVPLKYSFPR